MVGGGGGGGAGQSTHARGGGGGAGGLLFQTATIVSGASNTITIGSGGPGGASAGLNGTSGNNTVAFDKTMLGGGGGGAWVNSGNPNIGGGSGGGAGTPSATIGASTQFSTYGYGVGFAGGISSGAYTNNNASSAGGGGGSGGAGTAGAAGVAGRGGTGTNAYSTFLQYAGMGVLFTGTFYIAGGGGGGGGTAVGIGGIGGGGNGALATDLGSDATIFTGSGGGGSGGSSGGSAVGGAGASGVVIIRYLSGITNDALYNSSDTYFKNTTLLLSNQESISGTVAVDYLIVAGGGGGGGAGGGGGGAGGFRTGTSILSITTSLSIVVGSGGAGGASNQPGVKGNDSSFNNITSTGGGYGGTGYSGGTMIGGNGGSGGGGGYYGDGTFGPTTGGISSPVTVPPQGYAGGAGDTANNFGGGGGGSSGLGSGGAGSTGVGGTGTSSSITGIPTYYAGGGGGWGRNNVPAVALGGGGAGNTGGGSGAGGNGTAYTGGGGGGGAISGAGGTGGSGVVILRLPTVSSKTVSVTGSPIVTTTSSYTVYAFTSSGSITFKSNTNTTFLDSSLNALTITAPTGTPTQGSFNPFGTTWSNYFNGTTDRLKIPSNSTLAFGTGDFTVEAWVYQTADNTYPSVFEIGSHLSATGIAFISKYNGNATVYSGGFVGTAATILTQWNHIAWVRKTGVLTIFVNGIANTPVAFTNNLTDTSIVTIGGSQSAVTLAQYYCAGYISNLRVLKGTALYTSSFTPATAPLPIVTNTSLLTCASNRFTDKNSTATFTVDGTPSVSRFTPFPTQTYAYNTLVQGGSAYFNGSSQLTISSGSIVNFGTGAFTVEVWLYMPSNANNQIILYANGGSGSFNVITQASGLAWGIFGNPSFFFCTLANIPLNQWFHLAVSRVSTAANQTFGYINGALVVTATDANNYTVTGSLIGGNGTYYTGYMSNMRIVNGTAVYTSAFTPPAAPVFPINATTSTSLLLNFTNPAIYDATFQNNVITIGTSALSSTVTKYNPRSMKFNGTSDYLSLPAAAGAYDFGTGDFTVEFWMNATAAGTYVAVVGTQSIAGNTTAGMWRVSNRLNSVNGIYFNYTTGSAYTDLTFSTTNYNDGTWHHVAACRASGTLRLFVDGNSVGTPTAVAQRLTSGQKLYVGFQAQDSQYYTGYIDDLRITKIARYTANFIPPTAVPQLK